MKLNFLDSDLLKHAFSQFGERFSPVVLRIIDSGVIRALRDLTWVLWTCRIAVFSVALGWLLLGLPQTRDLFLDLSGETKPVAEITAITASMVWQAALLAMLVWVGWSLPAYFSAQVAIRTRIKLEAGGRRAPWRGRHYHAMQRWVPRLLGAAPFLVTLATINSLERTMFSADLYPWSAVGRNLMTATSITVAASLVGYVVCIRYGRSALRGLDRRLRPLPIAVRRMVLRLFAAFVPRLVIALLFGFLLLSLMSPHRPFAPLMDALGWLRLPVSSDAFVLRPVHLIPLILGAWIPILHSVTDLSMRTRFAVTSVILVGLVTANSFDGRSHPVRFGAFADKPAAAAGTGPKPTAAQAAAPDRAQVVLYKAVAQWMAAQGENCGDRALIAELMRDPARLDAAWRVRSTDGEQIGLSLGGTEQCPRPVIVAAAGGASRAAYMTASVLGHLLDITCIAQDGFEPGTVEPVLVDGGCRTRPNFANKLFAISGVSGGAVGAAIYGAAWTHARSADGSYRPPCRDYRGSSTYNQWFGNRDIRTWRGCLQAIASGDFLSPVALGLAFRDQIPLFHNNEADRAALLEIAWERSFNDMLNHPVTGLRMSDRFSAFLPAPGEWRPLLVMNGTSGSTGRRLLTSHLAPFQDSDYKTRLFPEALDMRELVTEALRVHEANPTRRCRAILPRLATDDAAGRTVFDRWDVSMATAASNSARFPLISPPGAIGCEYPSRFGLSPNVEIFDKVIDGGYFENYGLTTSLDLVKALEQEPFNLKPVVIMITNEPMRPDEWKSLFRSRHDMPPLPDAPEFSVLDWLATPLAGLYQTRVARGIDEVARMDAALRLSEDVTDPVTLNFWGPRLYHFSLFHEDPTGEAKTSVSMSWWLSKPAQEFMDRTLPQLASEAHAEVRPEHETLGRCINRNEFIRFCRRTSLSTTCNPHLINTEAAAGSQAGSISGTPWMDLCTNDLLGRLN